MASPAEKIVSYIIQPKEESFIDKHFAKIALAISMIALAYFAALDLILGLVLGLAISYYAELEIKPDRNVILYNALFAIVGATAAAIRMTPSGAAGGFVFQAIPFVCSAFIGTSLPAIKQSLKLG
jgi:hypothetical protein